MQQYVITTVLYAPGRDSAQYGALVFYDVSDDVDPHNISVNFHELIKAAIPLSHIKHTSIKEIYEYITEQICENFNCKGFVTPSLGAFKWDIRAKGKLIGDYPSEDDADYDEDFGDGEPGPPEIIKLDD